MLPAVCRDGLAWQQVGTSCPLALALPSHKPLLASVAQHPHPRERSSCRLRSFQRPKILRPGRSNLHRLPSCFPFANPGNPPPALAAYSKLPIFPAEPPHAGCRPLPAPLHPASSCCQSTPPPVLLMLLRQPQSAATHITMHAVPSERQRQGAGMAVWAAVGMAWHMADEAGSCRHEACNEANGPGAGNGLE